MINTNLIGSVHLKCSYTLNQLKVLVFDKANLSSMDAAPEPPWKGSRRFAVQVATL